MLFLHTGFQLLLSAAMVMAAVYLIPTNGATPLLFMGAGVPIGFALAALTETWS